MADGDLTILANALVWLGEDDDEGDVIERLITAVSSAIQKWLGYRVLTASYSRTFNGTGGRTLMLPDRPITAVTQLEIDDVQVPRSTSTHAPGFVFDDKCIYLRGFYEFTRGPQNVAINYTAGFATVPSDIEQACLDWVKINYDNLDTLPGISKLRAGDSEIDYGEVFAKIGSSTIPMPSVVAAPLIGYRRVTPT